MKCVVVTFFVVFILFVDVFPQFANFCVRGICVLESKLRQYYMCDISAFVLWLTVPCLNTSLSMC